MIMPAGKLSAQQVAEAISMRADQSLTFRQIAYRLSVSPETVRKVLKRYNIEKPEGTSPKTIMPTSPRTAIFNKLYPY